jgi:glycosyltransferase involved in cell wall biosynthesis
VLGPYIPDWPRWARSPEAPTPRALARAAVAQGARKALRAAQQRRAAAGVVRSTAAREKVQVRGEPPVVEVLPYGIDAGAYAPAQPDPGRPPTVLYLGSLHYRKGIFTLLEAHERVVARVPDVRLVVAGSGREEAAVRERVAASAARGSIELIGHVERAAVGATMARADVFCVPSYGEPFGLSALEAMACALPVVATAAGGLAHLVDAEGALTVAPRDAAGLADALATLLADPVRRAAMGAANRRRVERDYGWAAIIERLERTYARSVAAAARRGSRPR